MKSVIDELYDSNRATAIRKSKWGAEYVQFFESVCDLEHEILEKYPQVETLLRKYQNAEIDLANLGYRYEFEKGYKAGARMMLEVIDSN